MQMKAVAIRNGSNEPEIIETQVPEISPNRVLVRTVALGVCGTDRDILASGEPRTPPSESYLILGHEAVGTVEAVGEGVTGISARRFCRTIRAAAKRRCPPAVSP